MLHGCQADPNVPPDRKLRPDPKGGGVAHGPRIFQSSSCHHRPEVYGGIGERPAAELLRAFFRARRS
jgi:tRNA(Arg) A34 adenosine deaminase TadA